MRIEIISLLIVSIIIIFILVFRLTYNLIKKKKKYESSNNKIFLRNDWNNYQYFQFKINNQKQSFLTVKNKLVRMIKKWERRQVWFPQCNSLKFKLIITTTSELCKYLQKLIPKKVPIFNHKPIPYYIIFFKNEVPRLGCFLSHYYCDGQVFLDFLNYTTDSQLSVNFLNYNYIPIISDLRIINYLLAQINTRKKDKKKMLLSDRSYICIHKRKIELQFTKYDVYSFIFHLIFKCLSVNSLKVAFTVGIEDSYSMYNRIGVITRVITRQDTLLNYKIQIKKKLQNSSGEALVCYDLLKSFPIHLLRKNFNEHIDIVFTYFNFDNSTRERNNCALEFSSFLGPGKVPLYINSFINKKRLTTSFKISTCDFNLKKFLKINNCQIIYSFKSYDKENIYYRRYLNYRRKYLFYKKKEKEDCLKEKKRKKKKKKEDKKIKKQEERLKRLKKKGIQN